VADSSAKLPKGYTWGVLGCANVVLGCAFQKHNRYFVILLSVYYREIKLKSEKWESKQEIRKD
jgi:hypothetical protein